MRIIVMQKATALIISMIEQVQVLIVNKYVNIRTIGVVEAISVEDTSLPHKLNVTVRKPDNTTVIRYIDLTRDSVEENRIEWKEMK